MDQGLIKRRGITCFLFLGVFLFLIDALIKYVVFKKLSYASYPSLHYPYGGIGVFQNVLGIDFCLNCVTNRGGAWGVFASYPYILLALRLGIIVSLFVYATFVNKVKKRDFPFLLILTGASSNIFDCVIYGAVIDMFHFNLWSYSFPVFNLADMMIFFGVATLLIQTFMEKFKRCSHHETQSS